MRDIVSTSSLLVALSACAPAGGASSPCANGVQDVGELGVDCGGVCGQCGGASCSADFGCASGVCEGGLCVEAACDDGVRNGGETGIDCGGACPACVTVEATCTDAIQNGAETGVDCGGTCPACVTVGATCGDGIRNQDESDKDCGGDTCPLCGEADACRGPDDCASNRCVNAICAAPLPTCQNDVRDPGETDTDCGGPCAACATGKTCVDHGDCLSETCAFGVCRDPSCSDAIRNQGEVDADCGGPCPACLDGRHCEDHADCASATCLAGTCQPKGSSAGTCDAEPDCPTGTYCDWSWNDQSGTGAALVTECLLEQAGRGVGEACTPAEGCAGFGCVNGFCSEICADDAQCGADAVCALGKIYAENAALFEPRCVKFDAPGDACLSTDACADGQRCTLYLDETPGEPAAGPRRALGRCEDARAGGAAEGGSCATSWDCAVGPCHLGRCQRNCESSAECPSIPIEGQTTYRHCGTIVLGDARAADESDIVFGGVCMVNADRFHAATACGPSAGRSDTLGCGSGQTCVPRPIAWGPDRPGVVEWFCEESGAYPGGEPCSVDAQCASGFCHDLGAGAVCVTPCVDAGGCGAGHSCDPTALVLRVGEFAGNSVTVGACR